MTLIDINDQEIEVGDTVVYPQMSGRSVQMVKAKVVAINHGGDGKGGQIVTSVQVQRLQGARWDATSMYTSTKYRDKRTGKNVDIYKTDKHYEVVPSCSLVERSTGQVVWTGSHSGEAPWQFRDCYGPYSRYVFQWNKGKLHDYVEEYKPEPRLPLSTISNVKNVVKVLAHDGETCTCGRL